MFSTFRLMSSFNVIMEDVMDMDISSLLSGNTNLNKCYDMV